MTIEELRNSTCMSRYLDTDTVILNLFQDLYLPTKPRDSNKFSMTIEELHNSTCMSRYLDTDTVT
jgi:hypothetical protein